MVSPPVATLHTMSNRNVGRTAGRLIGTGLTALVGLTCVSCVDSVFERQSVRTRQGSAALVARYMGLVRSVRRA